jgi:phosphoribosyl 1,2-cyclic phosphodiesterase
MKIRCWGSRGSIPVSGRQYLKYGGDTTCLEIRTQSDDIIVVDAGTGIRRLGNRLMDEQRFTCHFLFTHAHWDHVMGFPFFKPVFLPEAHFFMHRCPFQSNFVEKVLSKVMTAPYFPIPFSHCQAKLAYEDACPLTFQIGSMTIVPVPLSHPNGGSGYKFIENGKTFVFLTDNELGVAHNGGLTADEYAAFAASADLLIHDAEYTPAEYEVSKAWGHSTWVDAVDLAIKAGVKRLGLFHLNQDRTDQQMDAMLAHCHQYIADAGADLQCDAVGGAATYRL